MLVMFGNECQVSYCVEKCFDRSIISANFSKIVSYHWD